MLSYAGLLVPVALVDGAGNAQGRQVVDVLNVDGTTATVYADAARTALTGVVASDATGNVSGVYAEPGVYRLRFSVLGVSYEVQTVASIDPREITDLHTLVDGGLGGGGGTPSGAAGGVLAGTYPNPGFAVDMATQAELDAEAALRAAADAALSTALATKETPAGAQAKIDTASTADRARSNHTGTQTSTTISDFTEAVQDAVAALLGAGTNITVNYDDAANTLTIATTAADAEAVRDVIGLALVGVGNISIGVNDALDTITISTAATVNSTDAQLRDRSTHTGTQPVGTITGLGSAALAATADFDAAGAAAAAQVAAVTAAKGLPLALTGATQPTRYVGRWSAAGAPATGTFAIGDFGFDGVGDVQVCTAAGTPGTWRPTGGGSGGVTATVDGTAASSLAITSATAADVPFTPTGTLGSTNVQAAIAEAAAEAEQATALAALLGAHSGIATLDSAGNVPLAQLGNAPSGGAASGGHGLYGDGSDGAATLDGTATVAWATLSGSTYTMTRDVFATSLTLNAGVTLKRAGFRVFATGTYTVNGTDDSSGSNASGATLGAAPAGGSSSTVMGPGSAGVSGSTTSAAAAAAQGVPIGGGGGTGGTGTGAPATPLNTAVPVFWQLPRIPPVLASMRAIRPNSTDSTFSGGWGGTAGSGDGTVTGGGSGPGGGVSITFAKTITMATTGIIQANGGNGAARGSGNTGGGGGGGGGFVGLCYDTLTQPGGALIQALAGSGGAGTGTGTAGSAGSAGTVVKINNT